MTSTAKKQQRTLGIVMVVLAIIVAIFFIIFWNASKAKIEDRAFEYNSIPFRQVNHGYELTFYVNEADYPTIMNVRNDPRTLENVSIDYTPIKQRIDTSEQIFISIKLEDNLTGPTTIAAFEINNFIDNPFLFDIPVNSAFFSPFEDVPLDNQSVKSCADATFNTTIIWLRLGDTTAIFEEDECLVVQGQTEFDIIRAADRLVLTLMGVMEA